jgi:hypothetical protein
MIRITQHVAILLVMALAAIAPHDANAAQGYYLQRNLITNFRDKYRTRLEPGRKTLRNDLVLNAWGLALRPAGAGGHWWIANTDSGTVVTYVGDTDTTPLFQDALKTVRVEPAPGARSIIHADRSGLQRLGRVPVCRRKLHRRPDRGPEPVPRRDRGRQPPVLGGDRIEPDATHALLHHRRER